ncbi:MAG TPA: hypothetical protein VFH68_05330 [Polyangia bacterium]|nr:hypothetical protein [Polyangia bacterium]
MRARSPLWRAPVAAAVLGAASACAAMRSPAPRQASIPATAKATTVATGAPRIGPERPRAEWLDEGAAAIWAGHLGRAERALLEVADREVRAVDPALDFWSELIALLRCVPARAAPRPSRNLTDAWDQLRRIVQVERLRTAPADEAGPAPGQAPRPGPAPAASRTLLVSPTPDGALAWPVERERWTDEAPATREVDDFCAPAAAPRSAADLTPARDAATRTEMMMVQELTGALPAGHPALPALLFEQAVLAIAAGQPRAALAPLARLPPAALAPGGPFSDGERAQLAFTWALAADADADADPGQRQAALPRLQAALAADLPRDVRRVLSFRLAEQLRAAGRIDEAVAAVGPPPHGDDAIGRYLAYRQMEAHVKAGRRAEALAEAREALAPHRRATIDGHTALAAIDDFAMRLLIGSPVTAKSIEVLEALGDPSERLARVERFALLAGTAGAHASGMEAFLWLMNNDPDENRRLHHLARASVAAARAGDRAQFSRTFALLSGEGDKLADENPAANPAAPGRGAAPPGRTPSSQGSEKDKRSRAAGGSSSSGGGGGLIASPDAERVYQARRHERSLSWQRAMLVVARDALPALVESDDQANLKTLVDRLQQHLTAHGRGPVDAELTTIYRAASAHLRGGARGYAERIGSGRRPILLGDIAVERRFEVRSPRVPLTPRGPRSLLWVPASGNDPSAARLRPWTAPLGVSLAVAEGTP